MSVRTLVMTMALSLALSGVLWAQGDNPRVKLETSMGDIVIELNPQAAPGTVQNFVDYVKSGHYDGTIFHHIDSRYMIQGGGRTVDMKQKRTKGPIKNEANNGLKNNKYTIAMARSGEPHTATAEFFINTNNNEFLNHTGESIEGWGYAVFGKVISGQEVVDSIAAVKIGDDYAPVRPVIINKAVEL